MKTTTFILAAALAAPLASLAQTTPQDDSRRIPAAKGTAEDTSGGSAGAGAQYGQGGSPHCDSLTGAQREQCLKDEGAKTDSQANPSSGGAAAAGTSASGSAAPVDKPKGSSDAERFPTK